MRDDASSGATYLYGVLAASAEGARAPRAHLDRTALRVVDLGWARALVSGEPMPAPPDAAAHRSVIAAAFARGETILPARAGQRFTSDEALARALDERRDALARTLARLAERAEMALFAPLAPADARPDAEPAARGTGPGAAHLARLAARAHAADPRRIEVDAWRDAVRAAAGSLVHDERVALHPAGGGALLSHLVGRDSLEAYRAAVTRITGPGGRRPTVRGPFAPFSFATLDTSGSSGRERDG